VDETAALASTSNRSYLPIGYQEARRVASVEVFAVIWDRIENQRLVVETLLGSEALLARVEREDLWGVGLFASYGGLTPGVVLDGSGLGPERLGIGNAQSLFDEELLSAINFATGFKGSSWLEVRIPEPALLLAQGDVIDAGNPLDHSTAGAYAQWYDMSGVLREGFITAGHGFSPNATVYDSFGVNIGTVVGHEVAVPGSPAPAADVSLVYLRPNPSVAVFNPLNGRTSALPPDDIDIHATPPKADTVGGLLKWFYVKSARITLGDLYMTQAGLTVCGDSGAAVTRRASVSGNLIGHLVAADPNFASYVQDIDFELRALSAFAMVMV
jgi:hypothetical protein